jgi:hypothetical protein
VHRNLGTGHSAVESASQKGWQPGSAKSQPRLPFIRHFNFRSYIFCNVASGREKGMVEKNVQDSRLRIWQDAAKERFGSFTELNLWLLAKCRPLWHELRHPEFTEHTIAEMLEHEQSSLMPMAAPFDGYVETLGKISSTCLVIYDRCRYSVPCELVGQIVSVRVYPEHLDFVAHDAVVASHTSCCGTRHKLFVPKMSTGCSHPMPAPCKVPRR